MKRIIIAATIAFTAACGGGSGGGGSSPSAPPPPAASATITLTGNVIISDCNQSTCRVTQMVQNTGPDCATGVNGLQQLLLNNVVLEQYPFNIGQMGPGQVTPVGRRFLITNINAADTAFILLDDFNEVFC